MDIKRKRIIAFLMLSFLISWGIIGMYILFKGLPDKTERFFLSIFFMFGPALATFISSKIFKDPLSDSLGEFFKPGKWFFVGWLIPVLLLPVILFINLSFPGTILDTDFTGLLNQIKDDVTADKFAEIKSKLTEVPLPLLVLSLTVQVLLAGTSINALAALGEEIGWRGYLYHQINHWGILKLSFFTGFFWGIWHAPLILLGHNYPDHRIAGVLMMILFCIALSPVMHLIRIKSKTVLPASVFHGTLNAAATVVLIFIAGGNDLMNGYTGIAGLLSLVLVNIGLFFYLKKHPIY